MLLSWIETDAYTGVDRRKAQKGLRLINRRRHDHAGPAPSLGQLIRRLRMHDVAVGGRDARLVFRKRLAPVVELARLRGERACANELASLMLMLDRGQENAGFSDQVLQALERAQEHLS